MIKGVIFDYGGTIDSRGEHWSWVLWRAWQHAGIDTDLATFRDCYVYAERYLARHRVIEPNDDFRTLIYKKALVELDRLAQLATPHPSTNPEAAPAAPLTDREAAPAAPLTDREATPAAPSQAFPGTAPGASAPGSVDALASLIADYCDAHARQCIAQARPWLEKLADALPMMLVSNFYGNVDAVLRAYDLRRYFQGVIESAVVGVRKPDPRIFMLGVVALGLEPAEVVVIGDSLKKDILPAQSIGCHTMWIKGRGWTDDEDAATHPSEVENIEKAALAILTSVNK